jgi:hypothetical protein
MKERVVVEIGRYLPPVLVNLVTSYIVYVPYLRVNIEGFLLEVYISNTKYIAFISFGPYTYQFTHAEGNSVNSRNQLISNMGSIIDSFSKYQYQSGILSEEWKRKFLNYSEELPFPEIDGERDVSLGLARLTIMLYELQHTGSVCDLDTATRIELCPHILIPACFGITLGSRFNGIECIRGNDGGDYIFNYIDNDVRVPFTHECYPKTPWNDSRNEQRVNGRKCKKLCLYIYRKGNNSGKRCTTCPARGTYCAKHKKYQP